MPRVTAEQLIQMLVSHPNRGAKLAVLVTRTRPPLLKKSRATGEPCPFADGVERLAMRQVTLGASYENAVNRQRLRDAEEKAKGGHGDGETGGEDDPTPSSVISPQHFTPEPLWNGLGVWDTRYSVRHAKTGRRYLAIKPAQRDARTEAGSVAVVLKDRWTDVATGRELDFKKDCLADYLRSGFADDGGSGGQAKSQTQHVEHDVQWRTIALDSIVELRYGDVYEVIHATEDAVTR